MFYKQIANKKWLSITEFTLSYRKLKLMTRKLLQDKKHIILFVKSLHSQSLKCSNEGFRCDPKTSVRGNLILFAGYHRKVQSSLWVVKLTFKMDLKESNFVILNFVLHNCCTTQYVYNTIFTRVDTLYISSNQHGNVFFYAKTMDCNGSKYQPTVIQMVPYRQKTSISKWRIITVNDRSNKQVIQKIQSISNNTHIIQSHYILMFGHP